MRLIDDDALLKAWDNLSERGRKEFDQVIMTQPTAYDIEKVIAELEKKDDDCGCGKIHIWDAIDIVKNGGK